MTRKSISLTIPAHTDYVGLVRTATLGFASRLDFPIDQLDELSHAAHEMTTLLLADTSAEGQIDVEITEISPTTIAITAKSRTNRGKTPRTDSFAWTILNALVDEAEATANEGIVTISASRSIQTQDATTNGATPTGAAL